MIYLKLTILSALLGYFLSQDRLFKPIRERITRYNRKIGELVSCPKCLSFWMFVLIFFMYQFNKAIVVLIYPLLTSLCAYIVYLVVEKLKN